MSLTVDVWVVDEARVGGRRILAVPLDASDLAERAAISDATGYGQDYLEFRLANMIDAAQRARLAGGGVVVW